MSTEDRFVPDHPLPLFLSGHAHEHEERSSLLLLNASILVLVVSLVGMAVLLSFGNPAKVFADIKVSLTDISVVQPGTAQPTPTQSTSDAKALPPTERGAPARGEIASSLDTAGQSRAEVGAAPPEALLKQFQDWAAKEDPRPQIETVRPAPDARAQALRNAQARVLRIQKH
jgi:hypothetical protein